MSADSIVALALVASSGILVLSGWKRVPGIGIIATLLLIALLAGMSPGFSLGLARPSSWTTTVLVAVVAGTLIQLLSMALLEPLAERVTGAAHDHTLVDSVKGDWKSLLRWLITVWILVAVLEEVIYRGFLLGEISRLVGGGTAGAAIGLALSSIIFGASHWYQGRAGAVSTTLVGALLGTLFIWSDYNLWLPILTHGVIDTLGLVAIATGHDQLLGRRLRQ
jgi:uncharacterized protein